MEVIRLKNRCNSQTLARLSGVAMPLAACISLLYFSRSYTRLGASTDSRAG
ncbi:hypothetical protein [Dryocola clanedunensis]